MEAVGRLRISSGLAVERYSGAMHRRNPVDVEFPALSCDQVVVPSHRHGMCKGALPFQAKPTQAGSQSRHIIAER